MPISQAAARELVDSEIVWYHRFELSPGIVTPGIRDVAEVLAACELRQDLVGLNVLDIGAANGGVAFECERRGASEVVAIDAVPGTFGLTRIREALGSRVEFVNGSVYDLPALVGGRRFDVVFFLGVLYHLRHPLHALDRVRAMLADGGVAYVESEVADIGMSEEARAQPLVRFYRDDGLAGDGTNWFVPTVRALTDWCESAGLRTALLRTWGDPPRRCLLHATPGEVEFARFTPEPPLG